MYDLYILKSSLSQHGVGRANVWAFLERTASAVDNYRVAMRDITNHAPQLLEAFRFRIRSRENGALNMSSDKERMKACIDQRGPRTIRVRQQVCELLRLIERL